MQINYFKYLKRSFPAYLICGTLLGLAVFSAAMIHRYDNYLTASLEAMNNINRKKEDIKMEIDRIDELIEYFQTGFDVREGRIDPEMLILHALDKMKARLDNAEITVSRFEDVEGETRLPVEIRLPADNYGTAIDCAGFIESFRLPDFRIKHFLLSKGDDGRAVVSIQGSFVAPSIQGG
ncbi:MAG: hypothetical protein HZA16_05350 [Nitrospirae bacterium]|nr:hypothetical protein [Nitrospirota bacterium]